MALPRAAHVARSTARRIVWPRRQIALASETRCEGDLAFASARRLTNDWRSQPIFGGEEFMGDNGGRALPPPTEVLVTRRADPAYAGPARLHGFFRFALHAMVARATRRARCGRRCGWVGADSRHE